MTRVQYDTVMKDLLGVTTVAGGAPSEMIVADSAGSLTDISWNGYLMAAEKIAVDVMKDATMKAKFIACDPAQAACLSQTIKDFGRKVFRRPLTTQEIADFEKFNSLTPKGLPAEVAESILFAFLASPSFIMLPEISQDKDGANTKLSSYEVAARLSFLIWNSLPDPELSMAADMGLLQTKEQINAQAVRLLQSPNAGAVAKTFHQAYADMSSSHWTNNTTHAKFPTFTAASYTASIAEMDSFFQDVMASGGSFKDLYLSPNAFVTNSTATIYGLKAADFTATPKKVELDPVKRPGFLTRAGFLSTHSHGDNTSPILRGAFINAQVLNIPPGTPDPLFAKIEPPVGNYKTNREAIEALTMNEPCAGCHATKINPPGFVLERYNAIGTWQDTDQLGGPINSTAAVVLATGNTKTLSTPAELMAEIAKLPTAQRLYVERFVGYAAQRSPNTNDACIVNDLAAKVAGGTYAIRTMMSDYTQADSFRLRTVGN